jgi:hypothetical protein
MNAGSFYRIITVNRTCFDPREIRERAGEEGLVREDMNKGLEVYSYYTLKPLLSIKPYAEYGTQITS